MKVHKLGEELLWFQFPPHNGERYGFSQYGLISGSQVLLLDAGYEDQSRMTVAWLHEQGFSVQLVVVSHFHRDHYEGVRILDAQEVAGSRHYKETLKRFVRNGDSLGWEVNRLLSTGDQLRFGQHELLIFEAPGHSSCSLITCIDRNIYHVGDLVIFDEEGSSIMPLLQKNGLTDHITSLEFLREQAVEVLLPAHGDPLRDPKRIREDLDHRLAYLKYLNSVPAEVLDPAKNRELAKLLIPFVNGNWHRYNRRAAGKLPDGQ